MVRRKYRESTEMEIPIQVFVTVIILAIFGTYLVIQHRDAVPVFQLKIQPSKAVYDLVRSLESKVNEQPKVIFRCLDDEPKIKYSKYASDDLTAMVMKTNDECGDAQVLDAIIIVHSAAFNFKRRQILRIYNNRSITYPYKLKIVFLIGQTLNANLQIDMEKENREYGDTIVGAFMDTYQNLTLKAVMGYRWLTETCQYIPLLIKIDDDVVFDVHKFFSFWKPYQNRKRTIMCTVWKGASVRRAGKWKVERALFANATYDFPYCSGFIVVVTGDLVAPLYNAAKRTDFFWIDDVFLYGMVPNTLSGIKFINVGLRLVHEIFAMFEQCRKAHGKKCRSWGILTKGEEQLQNELSLVWNFTSPIS